MADDYITGATADIGPLEVKSAAGTLTDPTTVQITVRDPAGTTTTYTYGTDSEVVKDATGEYRAVFEVDTAGQWEYTWLTSGGIALKLDGSFTVRAPFTTTPAAPENTYATVKDVAAANPARAYTPSSVPNTLEVSEFLERTAGEIDGLLLARGYSLPVATTATGALRLLRQGNVLGAAALVEQAAPSGAHGRRHQAWQLWQQWKNALASGSMELDAAKDPDRSQVRYHVADSTSASASAMFYRDMDH
jgi:hypothetical protein